jgi:4-hydroxythreonine-4-phosphate dehydrogenase
VTDLPRIAITMGDPAGIGPELIVRAAASGRLSAVPLVVGDPDVMSRAVRLVGAGLELRELADPGREPADATAGLLQVWRGGVPSPGDFLPGVPQAACGESAYQAILGAIELARSGTVAGVATAPISKEALHLAGHHYPGHTEIFAERTGTREFALMLADGPRRIVHVTCHVSVRQALDLLTPERILSTLRLGSQACRRLGVPSPRLAVCALNPHAGENGLFGDEEQRCLAPAIRAARAEGLDVTDPLPPDTVFFRAFSGEWDLVVAMLHDQGHIPFKLAGFQASHGRVQTTAGVNVTLGLPIVRTSVDHGTAWDIAWKGVAEPGSLLDAVDLAVRLSRRL